ncbi:MAG: helicase UvrD [Pseudonocardiales bacterium]|nr:helicase UvrD [Pseudonocardiales bacterium]
MTRAASPIRLRQQITPAELAERVGLPPPTAEQAEIIAAPLGAAVVIAGAGSGKTETMAARVLWLVANRHVNPDAVLGLTFTRKAAAELGTRIRRQLRRWALHADPEQRNELLVAEPTVLTYAAYSGRLLADHALRLGLEPSTRLISPAVSWQLSDSVVRRFDGELDDDIGAPSSVTNYVLQLAGELADHLRTPAEVITFTDDMMARIDSLPPGPGARSEYPGELAKLVKTLRHRRQLLPLVAQFAIRKLATSSVDFADQMVWAAKLARLPAVREIERDRYRAVLLDEYQDTGHAQIELLTGLFDDGHPVTAVGDPFQSIYSWRGASAGNIGRFAFRFAGNGRPADTFTLSTSWRNDAAILTAANAVAEELRAVHPGTTTLQPSPAAGPGEVTATFAATVEDEAEWVAAQINLAWRAARVADPKRPRSAAVLVRRRAQIPALDAALRAVGLPVEIVGLGGLLTTPEVIDVVATLHVLADYTGGAALLRLLTGARWRIGSRDLVALSRRAGELANPDRNEVRQQSSIVEALDDLGDKDQYSIEGYRRMNRFAGELRRLRGRLSAPLPDLVADVERTIGVDVEVAARADRAHIGRVHLDRFLDAAAGFAADADEATLGAFLAYLTAAEDEENGLEAGEIEVETERIQILTVHGSKGLEWDLVAVPGLVDQVFPSQPKGNDWTRARHLLPFPLRGDSADLPVLEINSATHRRELAAWLKDPKSSDDHDSKMKARHLLDERRLAYVAFTRARHALFASGFAWDDTKEARSPSPFLHELAAKAEVDGWYVPEPGEPNPRDALSHPFEWPFDPLGGRREEVAQGAELVRAAMNGTLTGTRTAVGADEMADSEVELVESWQRDLWMLLAERAAREPGQIQPVVLPSRLSVSQLVSLQDNPAALARRLHRPLPARPAPLARRGTAFHLWLERRWGGETLLDLDELPGASDETATDDSDLVSLREAFLASPWAHRTPLEVEVPFEMVFDGVVVRGRMDAVFREGDPDDLFGEQWVVVDWKTGEVPAGRQASAAAVQLAAYRLAWHRIAGVPLESVRAAFHYVRSNTLVEPANLLDAEGLRQLILADPDPNTE